MTEGEERHRIAFTVHYDGTAFFGWQLQPDRPSVQGLLESVASRLFARPARVVGSGRTDRGVHALGQVAMVKAPVRWTAAEFRRAANALLPNTVWVSHAAVVDSRFHPRYDAIARSYRYRVGTTDAANSPFRRAWCWPVEAPLDLARMQQATQPLVGDLSFKAFAKAGQEHRGDRCIVSAAEWVASGDDVLEFRITANRFLHHMVRYLVGTHVEIGMGRREPAEMAALLDPETTLVTSPPAPPDGLFLSRVEYPEGSYSSPRTESLAFTLSDADNR